MIKKIKSRTKLLAIIIPSNFQKPGLTFVTPDDFPQQLAYMNYPRDKEIQPHQHLQMRREIYGTKETLYIKKGSLLVNFFDENRKLIKHTIVNTGDIILLVDESHGFKTLQDTEIIEIKQGPYLGEQDKVKF